MKANLYESENWWSARLCGDKDETAKKQIDFNVLADFCVKIKESKKWQIIGTHTVTETSVWKTRKMLNNYYNKIKIAFDII